MGSMSFQRLIVPTCCFVVGILLAAWVSRFTTPARAEQNQPAMDGRSATALMEAAKGVYQGYKKQKDSIGAVERPARGGDNGDYYEFLYRWSRRWLEAELAVDKAKNKQIAAHAAHLDRMKGLEAIRQAELKGGQAVKFEVAAVEYFRIEAEQWLAKAKGN
jgi:hypothetical protein